MSHEWKLTSVPDFFYDPEFNPPGEKMHPGYEKKRGCLGWKCSRCGLWAPPQFGFSNPPHPETLVDIFPGDGMNCEEAVLHQVMES